MASRSVCWLDKTSSAISPRAPIRRANKMSGDAKDMKFATRAIHVGQEADAATGATIVPVYQTSTYTQERVGVHKGYDYSRTTNPTRVALEKQLASLEGGEHACAFASGVA